MFNKFENITIFLVLLLAMGGCKNKEMEQKISKLDKENQELQAQLEKRDSTIQHLMTVMDGIEEDLDKLAQRQEELEEIENGKDVSKKVKQHVNEINKLLGAKEEKYESLQEQFYYAKSKIRKMKQEMDTLQGRLDKDTTLIDSLEKQVMALQEALRAKDSSIMMLDSLHREKMKKYEFMDSAAHLAYFKIGKENELIKQGVLMKTGGFLGFLGRVEVINPGFSDTLFKALNTKHKTEFRLGAKSKDVELITPHPPRSYRVKEISGDSAMIKVMEPVEFWKISDYMLVSLQ